MADDHPLPSLDRGLTTSTATLLTVSVREMTVMADIGINPEEIGVPQPLIVSVDLQVQAASGDHIGRTIDYRLVAAHAEALAVRRTALIETFAEALANLCLVDPRVEVADVRIDKPQALANGTASVRIVVSRPNLLPARRRLPPQV